MDCPLSENNWRFDYRYLNRLSRIPSNVPHSHRRFNNFPFDSENLYSDFLRICFRESRNKLKVSLKIGFLLSNSRFGNFPIEESDGFHPKKKNLKRFRCNLLALQMFAVETIAQNQITMYTAPK